MTKHQSKPQSSATGSAGIGVCVFELRRDGSRVHLLPDGEFRARDGRPTDAGSWRVSPAIAERLIAASASRRGDLVIDYEHQTLRAAQNGKPAPAAGWFHNLGYEPGKGVTATDVRWTERAAAFLADQEYRYISAVFRYRVGSGEVLEILHAGLTNNPAVDGLDDVAGLAAAKFSLQSPTEADPVNQEQLKLLGLEPGATDDQINTALAELTARAEKSDELESQVAALKAETDRTEEPDPAKFVPIGVVEELRTRVAELVDKQVGSEVEGIVTAALSDGRLLPAQEKWARSLGKSDLAALKAYVETATPIAALKAGQTGGQAPKGTGAGDMDDDALAVCTALGVDPGEFQKHRADQAAA